MTRLTRGLAVVLISGLCLTVWLLRVQNGSLRAFQTEQCRVIGELNAANARLARSLQNLRQRHEAERAMLVRHQQENEESAARARNLERQLWEALHAEADFDRTLSRAITDALCLRWREASGSTAPDHSQGNPAAAASAAPANTAAAGSSGADSCAGWRGLKVGAVIEWSGLLLDHAAREASDKATLRAWSDGTHP